MATGCAITFTSQNGTTAVSQTTIVQGTGCTGSHGGAWLGTVSDKPICHHDEAYIVLRHIPGNNVSDWKYGFFALDKTIYVNGQYTTCPRKTADLIIPMGQNNAGFTVAYNCGESDNCLSSITAHRITDE